MSILDKIGHYIGAIYAFLSEDPREANTEGGIFPAIFGTITMVILMAIIVTPFGVLAAIYLREYAKQGTVLKIIRISVYNLSRRTINCVRRIWPRLLCVHHGWQYRSVVLS